MGESYVETEAGLLLSRLMVGKAPQTAEGRLAGPRALPFRPRHAGKARKVSASISEQLGLASVAQ